MWQPGDEILFLFLFNLGRAQRWSGVVRQRYVLSFHDDSFQIMSLDIPKVESLSIVTWIALILHLATFFGEKLRLNITYVGLVVC